MKKILKVLFVVAVMMTMIGICAEPSASSNFTHQFIVAIILTGASASCAYVLYEVIENYDICKALFATIGVLVVVHIHDFFINKQQDIDSVEMFKNIYAEYTTGGQK